MKKLLILFFVVGTTCLLSCSEPTEMSLVNDPQVDTAITEANKINNEIAQGYLLKNSTEANRKGIQSLILDVRAALLHLKQHPNNKTSLKILDRSIEEIKDIQILRDDEGRLLEFIKMVGAIAVRVSTHLGVPLQSTGWNLFTYRFSKGLAPFSSFSTNIHWDTDFNLPKDRNYAFVKNTKAPAWLLSPQFDLSQVQNPSFRFSHIISIDNSNREKIPFDRQSILNEVFHVMVSTDYTDGDPEHATWTPVSMGDMPATIDFDEIESPRIDLGSFKGKKVTIAFKFHRDNDTIKKVGEHYITWQIIYFKLFGLTEDLKSIEYSRELHRHEFKHRKLDPFKVVQFATDGPVWVAAGYRENSYDFAKVEANQLPTDTWLLSPMYTLKSQRELSLNVFHVVRNAVMKNLKVKISDNYRGGDPRLAQWEEFAVNPDVIIDESNKKAWIDLSMAPIDLQPYLGKNIVIAFQFIDAGELLSPTSVWEIKALTFKGYGGDIIAQDYDLNFNPGNP